MKMLLANVANGIAALALACVCAALPAMAQDKATVGHSGPATDSVFDIAAANGNYKDENLAIEHIHFDSTAKESALRRGRNWEDMR